MAHLRGMVIAGAGCAAVLAAAGCSSGSGDGYACNGDLCAIKFDSTPQTRTLDPLDDLAVKATAIDDTSATIVIDGQSKRLTLDKTFKFGKYDTTLRTTDGSTARIIVLKKR